MKNGRAASIEVEDLSSGRGEGQDGLSCQKGRHSDGGRLYGGILNWWKATGLTLLAFLRTTILGGTGEVMLEAIRLVRSNALECIQCVPGAPESLDHPLLSSKMSSIFRRRRCVSAKALSQWPRAVLI